MTKIALAQISSDPGCFEANTNKIITQLKSAQQQNVDLVVFPELCIPGYAHMDLVQSKEFLRTNLEALEKIKSHCQGITALVGFVDQREDKLYNSVAVIRDSEIQSVIHKQLLPNYDIFYDHRYYTPGEASGLVDICGLKVGIGICEDLWDAEYDRKVYQTYLDAGADLLINMSASPFESDKQQQRVEVVENLLKRQQVPFVYCNLLGSYDCYDGEIVFDGSSFIRAANGQYYEFAKSFAEDLKIIDLERSATKELMPLEPIQAIRQALCFGIKEYFRRSGFKHAYIGVSGGIDSAVTLGLASEALGPDNVTAVTMPSEITSEETLSDAKSLAENLGIDVHVRSIANLVAAWREGFEEKYGHLPNSLTKQNIQARLRGLILMEYVNEDPRGLVISAGNKTELALGYCTLYGDMCGGLAAISDVSKTQVYQLADLMNRDSEVIPKGIIAREPTAELEPDQKDVDNLPAEYEILSPLVDDLVEGLLDSEQLAKRYDKEIVNDTRRLIKVNEHKRRQAAPGIRITTKAFGIGRRVPISHGWR